MFKSSGYTSETVYINGFGMSRCTSIVRHHNESRLCVLIFLLTALNKHVLSPPGSLKAYSLIMLINSCSAQSTCSPHSQLPTKSQHFNL